MRAPMNLLLWLTVILLSACTRPGAVKEVATQAEVLLNRAHRSGEALREQLTAQRTDLAHSAAGYDAIRRDTAQNVTNIETEWRDAKLTALSDQLKTQRAFDQQVREDPFAQTLIPVQPALEVPEPPALDIAGLIKAARALERMQGDRAISLTEALRFAQSVSDELQKLQDEQNKP
jgi:hypothetical protein